ncbi:MAG: hypothetical protein K9H26_00295 [Prolixibacteraceae bacterium]|nr:hypothetical protein [Prolixibacteraceae bacterium]
MILGSYSLWVITKFRDQIISDPNDLNFWGENVHDPYPVAIVTSIIIQIIFAIINRIASGKDEPDITDEIAILYHYRKGY